MPLIAQMLNEPTLDIEDRRQPRRTRSLSAQQNPKVGRGGLLGSELEPFDVNAFSWSNSMSLAGRSALRSSIQFLVEIYRNMASLGRTKPPACCRSGRGDSPADPHPAVSFRLALPSNTFTHLRNLDLATVRTNPAVQGTL